MLVQPNSVTIHSRLTEAEVVQLLRHAVPRPSFLSFSGIVGTVSTNTAKFENRSFLRKHERQLQLRFASNISGTLLRGEFHFPLGTRLVFGLMLVVTAMTGAFSLPELARGNLKALAPWLILIAAYFAMRLDLQTRTRSELELVEFLRDLLENAAPATVTGGTVIRPRHLQPDHEPTHPIR